AHLGPTGIVCIGEIEQMIGRKLRMQHDAHQTALAARLDVRHDEQWLGAQFSVLKDPYPSGPLGKETASVWRPHNRPDDFEIRNHCFYCECALRLRRSLDFTRAPARRRMTASEGEQDA